MNRSKPLPMLALCAIATLAGCAANTTSRLVAMTVQPHFTGAKVEIEGLGFLDLYMPHARAIELMREHGYSCHEAAATLRYSPCTRSDKTGPQAVVLAFEGSALAAVRTQMEVTDKDPRDQFERIYASSRKRYPRSYVEQHEFVYFARFFPGDGSVIELRYFIFADSMENEHRAPAPQIVLLAGAP